MDLLFVRNIRRFPPKVEYSMTEMGKGLRPVVKVMYEWIEKYGINK